MKMELILFARACWYGGLLFFVYDCLRILRQLLKHPPFLTGMEDVLYWICSGLYLFRGFYRDNDGMIRGYILTGVLLGMLVWHFTVSGFYVRMVTKMLSILTKRLKLWGIKGRILLNGVLHKRSREKNGKKKEKKKKSGKQGKSAAE